MVRKQSDTVHLKLRFSEKLRLRVEAAADHNQRSMNSEIVHRLEQSFEKHDRMADIKAAAMETATLMVEKFQIVGRPKVRTKT